MSYFPQDLQGYANYGYPAQGYVFDGTQQAQQTQAQQTYAYPQWQQAQGATQLAQQQQQLQQLQQQQQQQQQHQTQTQQLQQQQQQQQLQQQQQRHGRYGSSHKPAKNPKDTVSIHCDICELNCLGQDAYNAHMVGRKHAAAAKRKAASEGGDRYAPYTAPGAQGGHPPPKPATGKFFCELCHIYSTDQNTFALHLNGRKHYAAAQAAQKATGAAPPPPSTGVIPISPVTTPTTSTIPTTPAPVPSLTPTLPPPAPIAVPSSPVPPATPPSNLTIPSPSTSIPTTPSPTLASPTPNSPQIVPNIPPTLTIPSSPSLSPPTTPSPKNQNRPGPFRRGYNRGGGGGSGPYGRYNKNMHVNTLPVGKSNNNNNNMLRPQISTPNNAPPPSTLSMGPSNSNDDNLLNAKHAELSPSAASAMALAALVRTVSNKLNEIGKKTSEDGVTEVTPKVVVSETKLVGSYAKGTMLKGNLCADIVAITQAPPTHATLEVLHQALTASVPEAKVTLHLENSQIHVQENDYNTHIMVTWLGAWSAKQDKDGVIRIEHSESEHMQTDTHSNTVTTTTVVTSVTTVTSQTTSAEGETPTPTKEAEMTDLVPAPALPLIVKPQEDLLTEVNIEACQGALLAIRQLMWFNDHQMSPNIRSVMRLMLDFRSRNEVFQVLTPWTTEIIVAHALRTNPPNSSISQSLRSVFAYMASGVLLPGIELIDPCHQEPVNVLSSLSADQRLGVTALAQELIRDIAYGKWERVVGTA